MLPSGRLREPLSSLTRASALAFVHDGSAAQIPGAGDQYRWRVLRGIVAPETAELCFAFCGIARPTNFFTELGQAGLRVVGTHEFRDHHAYTATDVELLFKLGQEVGATAFVTTEKDAVNLGEFAERLHPLHVVPVRMEFEPLSRAGSLRSRDLRRSSAHAEMTRERMKSFSTITASNRRRVSQYRWPDSNRMRSS